MWLFYERELFGGEDFEIIIPRMIYQLEAGLVFARNTLREIETSSDDDTEGCESTTDESNE